MERSGPPKETAAPEPGHLERAWVRILSASGCEHRHRSVREELTGLGFDEMSRCLAWVGRE